MGEALQIAFGKRRIPGSVHEALEPGHAVVANGARAICLNSPGWVRLTPELITAAKDRATLRLLCRDGLARMTNSFSAAAARTIRRYFKSLETRYPLPNERSADLFDATDRYFSALLPMPAPTIAVTEIAAMAERPAESDLAFWNGDRLTLIRFGGFARETPGQRNALEMLIEKSPVEVHLHRAPEERDASLEEVITPEVLDWEMRSEGPAHGPIRLNQLQEWPLPAGGTGQ